MTALLPRETVAFGHIPDFNRLREEWHSSDIYQLYSEPAVQDFLNKPLARMPANSSSTPTLQEFAGLEAKDGFIGRKAATIYGAGLGIGERLFAGIAAEPL